MTDKCTRISKLTIRHFKNGNNPLFRNCFPDSPDMYLRILKRGTIPDIYRILHHRKSIFH